MSNIPQREAFLRMNLLQQAATMQVLNKNPNLARFYAHVMKSIAQKLVIRLDTSVKRSICKRCGGVLIAGVSSKVRVNGERDKHVNITCTSCHYTRSFVAGKGHKPFSQKTKTNEVIEGAHQQNQKGMNFEGKERDKDENDGENAGNSRQNDHERGKRGRGKWKGNRGRGDNQDDMD